jgi:putative SOS response-associated peptidase YedK
MLTINADKHPFFFNELKPDPKRPPHMQDKRMVVILNEDSYEAWLEALVDASMNFMRQYPTERLTAVAEPVVKAEPAQLGIDGL